MREALRPPGAAAAVAALAFHAFREQFRNKAYLLILGFGAVMLYASTLLGVLAVDEELRVLEDLGLALIELTALAAVAYGAAASILQELETKTIYLILTRPVAKWQYLLGRFLGLLLLAAAAIAGMSALHLALLLWKGGAVSGHYPLVLLSTFLKTGVAGSLAALFALLATSVVSALFLTSTLWILGHILPEVAFLVREGGGSWLLKPSLYVAPNLALLNLRDRFDAPGALEAAWAGPVGYAVLYSGVVLLLALCLFERREF